jgi:hypothetical protein
MNKITEYTFERFNCEFLNNKLKLNKIKILFTPNLETNLILDPFYDDDKILNILLSLETSFEEIIIQKPKIISNLQDEFKNLGIEFPQTNLKCNCDICMLS